MTTYARFYERDGDDLTTRYTFTVESAEGVEMANGIGHGKVVIPHYDNFRLSASQRIQPGDVCQAWTTAPDESLPHYITTFIVKSRSYKNGKYEVSGPDFIGELQDYVAIAPVGAVEEVETTAESMGARRDWTTDPDTWIPLEAAYAPRAFLTDGELTYVPGKTKYYVLAPEPIPMQVTDTVTIYYPDGPFITTISDHNDRHDHFGLTDAITETIPGGTKIVISSKRLRVDDASEYVVDSQLFYTPILNEPGKTPPTLIVETVEIGDGSDPDYLYFYEPITNGIAAGSTVTQKLYTTPTTGDVAMLLEESTFEEWRVTRDASATTGTSYAPYGESVWDVLLAICEISGHNVRRLYGGTVETDNTPTAPTRMIQYFATGATLSWALRVTDLGMNTRLDYDYGTLLSVEYEDTREIVSHLIPYGGGGGGGRLSIKHAPIGDVLEDYDDIENGIMGNTHYIYNTELDDRPVWREVTFNQITPTDPNSPASRREAAEMLLRTGADWLMAHSEIDRTFRAEVFTIGEPRPGDTVDLTWEGADPTSTTASNLIITEVRHEVTPDRGWRMTTLTMSDTGQARLDGQGMVARSLLTMERVLRRSNFGGAGDARVTYDGTSYGGEGRIIGNGDVTIQSTSGDVTIKALLGDVFIDSGSVTVDAPVNIDGDLHVDGAIVLGDEGRGIDWALSVLEVRGTPRIRLTRRARS